MTMTTLRPTARTAIVTLLTVLLPASALALRLPHLKLKASFPAKDAVLTTSPDAVRLWLSEPADVPATRITVKSAQNAIIATAKPTRGTAVDAPLEAKFTTPPAAGRYTVTWKAMSKDGHVVNGTFGFTVKTAP